MIYIDLIKAASTIPNVSVDTPDENRAARQFDSSFRKVPVGVTGGTLSPDRDDVGARWRGKEPVSVEEEEAENAKKDDEVDEEIKLDAAKSLLKSVTHHVYQTRAAHSLNPAEEQFLTEVLGYSRDSLIKGAVVLSPEHRVQFNRWLCDRFRYSVKRLVNE